MSLSVECGRGWSVLHAGERLDTDAVAFLGGLVQLGFYAPLCPCAPESVTLIVAVVMLMGRITMVVRYCSQVARKAFQRP